MAHDMTNPSNAAPCDARLAMLIQHMQSLDGPAAIALYNEESAQFGHVPELHNIRGRLALAGGKPEEARTFFHHSLLCDPDNYVAHVELGRIALADKQPAEAWQHFNSVTPTSNNALKLGDLRWQALMGMGEYGKAAETATGMMEANPDRARPVLLKAIARLKQGRLGAAFDITDQLVTQRLQACVGHGKPKNDGALLQGLQLEKLTACSESRHNRLQKHMETVRCNTMFGGPEYLKLRKPPGLGDYAQNLPVETLLDYCDMRPEPQKARSCAS